jgi:hypothetical protein
MMNIIQFCQFCNANSVGQGGAIGATGAATKSITLGFPEFGIWVAGFFVNASGAVVGYQGPNGPLAMSWEQAAAAGATGVADGIYIASYSAGNINAVAQQGGTLLPGYMQSRIAYAQSLGITVDIACWFVSPPNAWLAIRPQVGAASVALGWNTGTTPTPIAPVVTPNQIINTAVGEPVVFHIQTTGGTPTSFAVTPALPGGLVLNTATGVITGIPVIGSDAGSPHTVTITASNAQGTSPGVPLVVHISESVTPQPPEVLPPRKPSTLHNSAAYMGMPIVQAPVLTAGGHFTDYWQRFLVNIWQRVATGPVNAQGTPVGVPSNINVQSLQTATTQLQTSLTSTNQNLEQANQRAVNAETNLQTNLTYTNTALGNTNTALTTTNANVTALNTRLGGLTVGAGVAAPTTAPTAGLQVTINGVAYVLPLYS